MVAEQVFASTADIDDVNASISALRDMVLGVGNRVDDVETQLGKLDQSHQQMLANFTQLSTNVASEKQKMLDGLKAKFDEHSLALSTIVVEAKKEFETLKQNLQNIAGVSEHVFK